MTPEQWQAFVQSHGGVAGSMIVDPTIKQDKAGITQDVPNPSPHSKVTFNDGTTVTIDANSTTSVNVVDPGTALKPAKSGAATEPRVTKDKYGNIYSENPDGSLTLQVTGQPNVPTSGTAISGLTGGQDVSLPEFTALSNYYDNQQKNGLAQIQAQLEAGRLSVEQAQQQATALNDQLSRQLQAQSLALTARGQDITSADSQRQVAATERGQDLNFADSQAQNTVTAYRDALPFMVSPGYASAFNQAVGNIGKPFGLNTNPNLQPMQFPYDPASITQNVTAKALAGVSDFARSVVGAPPGGPTNGAPTVTQPGGLTVPANAPPGPVLATIGAPPSSSGPAFQVGGPAATPPLHG